MGLPDRLGRLADLGQLVQLVLERRVRQVRMARPGRLVMARQGRQGQEVQLVLPVPVQLDLQVRQAQLALLVPRDRRGQQALLDQLVRRVQLA